MTSAREGFWHGPVAARPCRCTALWRHGPVAARPCRSVAVL